MINTVNIKEAQLRNGFFTTGSGIEVILVMGSCRVVNYVNYLKDWNEANGNRFTIHSLDPFNNHWGENDERVDYDKALERWETDERMLSMLASVDIFLHEFYQNSGMFNVNKDAEKNIYQFGLNPVIDVCIPSWNDIFVLFADIITFDVPLRKMALQDYNVIGSLSEETQDVIFRVSNDNLQKFYNVCLLSDIPEMKDYFEENMRTTRFWWTYNHTSRAFTLAIFIFLNDKYLHLDLSKGFNPDHEDMFANSYTKLTEYDIKFYNFEWGEEIIDLKDKLL